MRGRIVPDTFTCLMLRITILPQRGEKGAVVILEDWELPLRMQALRCSYARSSMKETS